MNEQDSFRQVLKVYTVIEKPPPARDYWLEIGVATVNKDRSLNVKLDALPVSGRLQIREPSPRPKYSDDASKQGNQQRRGQ